MFLASRYPTQKIPKTVNASSPTVTFIKCRDSTLDVVVVNRVYLDFFDLDLTMRVFRVNTGV